MPGKDQDDAGEDEQPEPDPLSHACQDGFFGPDVMQIEGKAVKPPHDEHACGVDVRELIFGRIGGEGAFVDEAGDERGDDQDPSGQEGVKPPLLAHGPGPKPKHDGCKRSSQEQGNGEMNEAGMEGNGAESEHDGTSEMG